MKFKDKKPTKGLLFAGCSYTWGQGLYYYSNLPSLKEPENNIYNQDYVRYSHYKFMKTIRFSRLVANHFKTFEICQDFNGGNYDRIHNYWYRVFDNKSNTDRELSLNHFGSTVYSFEDFSDIVYQITCWERSYIYINDPVFHNQSYHDLLLHPKSRKFLVEYLNEKNITLEEFEEIGIKKELEKIKKFLAMFEDNGIRAHIFSWPSNIINYILKDPWLSERLFNIEYQNKIYTNLEDLMTEHEKFKISKDYENFEIPPGDDHPSAECHKVISQSIINRLSKFIP